MIYKNKGLMLILYLIVVMPVLGWSAIIMRDSFDDGDFTAKEGINGMSWVVASGSAVIRNESNQMALYRGGTLVHAEQRINKNEYTFITDGSITWSEHAMLVVLLIDKYNYYAVGIGGKPGIWRVMGGREEQLCGDSAGLIRLPHASGSTGRFKIHVENNGSYITIKADRMGDGIDYDLVVRDNNPSAVERFVNTTVGFWTAGDTFNAPWFSVDNIEVHDVCVENPREPATYYVSVSGNDSISHDEARNVATPWRSIQKAADAVLAGDTVFVLPGVYRETVSLKNSGIDDMPITFKAYHQNNRPVLDGSDDMQTFTWETVTVVDFRGNTHQVYRTQIDWFPKAVYQNGVRLFRSHEPDQTNPDDPYSHSDMREVPNEYNTPPSFTELFDPNFLVQSEQGYWAGGILMLYQRNGNYIAEKKIVDYIPQENKIITESFGPWTMIGPDNDTKPDLYTIANHLGVLDKPGEYCLTGNTTPYFFYVYPYPGQDISTVTAAKYENGFSISSYRNNIIIDGFEIVNYQGNGIRLFGNNKRIEIKNCDIHRNMGSGISGDTSTDVIIDKCYIHRNEANGVSFGSCKNITVQNCEITANSDNGIWVGTGGWSRYNGENIIIRNNYIHRQGGGRSHPDNYQMHQVKNIIIENNIFIQDGHQNMWCQYTDNFILRNNLFLGGVVGINSSINSMLYNNVFHRSTIRYDAHTANHPEYGGDFMPQTAKIKNNIIIDSAITYPSESLVNKEKCFNINYNYYNIPNSWSRGSWSNVRGVGFGENSIVSESSSTLVNIISVVPNDNYTLYNFYPVPTSPLIDAGTTLDFTYDLEYVRRPANQNYDIGPYEYSSVRGSRKYPVPVITVNNESAMVPFLLEADAWHSYDMDGSIVSYEWDFGDGGERAYSRKAIHNYTTPGEYLLTLTVTDNEGNSSMVAKIIIVEGLTIVPEQADIYDRKFLCLNNVIKPGNPSATVRILIEEDQQVSVVIYDARGRKVYVLWDEIVPSGAHQKYWDGTDSSGSKVGSGVYMVHFKAGKNKETKKIVVVK